MFFHRTVAAVFLLLSIVHASPAAVKRQLPAQPTGVTTITSPNGAEIRYKEPGKEVSPLYEHKWVIVLIP